MRSTKCYVVDWNKDCFEYAYRNTMIILRKTGYSVTEISVVPISGWTGENLVEPTSKSFWYKRGGSRTPRGVGSVARLFLSPLTPFPFLLDLLISLFVFLLRMSTVLKGLVWCPLAVLQVVP